MDRKLADYISDYRNDPYYPSPWVSAVFWGAREWFYDRVTSHLNNSLFRGKAPRELTRWERFLLWLGF